MEPREQDKPTAPPTLEEQIANSFAQRQRNAALLAEHDAQQEARAEAKRKAAVAAEVEKLARVRLAEWLDGGGTEEEFRQQWPGMLAKFFEDKHTAKAAARQELIDRNRIF